MSVNQRVVFVFAHLSDERARTRLLLSKTGKDCFEHFIHVPPET